jgi:DNA primase
VIAFGGRLIPNYGHFSGDEPPKYINSPETILYKKSGVLYGMPQAQASIREEKSLYIVEGYMDVVSLHQAGVKNVLATCGTALTPQHAKKLARMAPKIILLFDGDSAGQNASAKAFLAFKNLGVSVEVRYLPEEDDPDSLALKYPKQLDEKLKMLPHTTPFESFLKAALERRSSGGPSQLDAAAKGAVAEEIVEALVGIENQVELDQYLERAAFALGVSIKSLTQLLKGGENKEFKIKETFIESEAPTSKNCPNFLSLPKLDQELILALLARRGELFQEIHSDPILEGILTIDTIKILEEFNQALSSDNPHQALKELLIEFGGDWAKCWKEACSVRQDKSFKIELQIRHCQISAKKRYLEKIHRTISEKLKNEGDTQVKSDLYREQIDIIKEIKKLAY